MAYTTDRSLVLIGKQQGTPDRSWWICPEEEFHDRAHEAQPRMRQSRFALVQFGNVAADVKADRRRRLPV